MLLHLSMFQTLKCIIEFDYLNFYDLTIHVLNTECYMLNVL